MILGFLGQPRSGKTLLMTAWLKKFYKAGYKVISNYYLSFPFEPFSIEVIDAMVNDDTFNLKYNNLSDYYKANKIVIAIDEIASQMDSRTAMRKENVLLSYMLMQAGKRDITVMWTAQLPHSVDKRLKDLTEFITFSERSTSKDRTLLGFSYRQIDMYHKTWKSFFLPLNQATKLYPLYNTKERVRPQRLNR